MRKFFLRRRNIKISEENIAEYHRRTEEMQKKRHSYLKQRLEALNDGIIAIIITIMVLEVPLPNGQNIASYYNFLGSLSVFLVSFFVVANFWYELGQSLALVDEIDKGIIMFVCIVAYRITDAVGNIILQPAFLNGQHFIECSRNVETYCIHLVILHVLTDFLTSQPAFV